MSRSEPWVLGMYRFFPRSLNIYVVTPPQEDRVVLFGRESEGEYLRYSLNIPLCLWKISIYKNGWQTQTAVEEVFFLKNTPVTRTDNPDGYVNRNLYTVPMPNMYDEGGLCHGVVLVDDDISIIACVNEAIEGFWSEPFNDDITHAMLDNFASRRFKARHPEIVGDYGIVNCERAFAFWEKEGVFPWARSHGYSTLKSWLRVRHITTLNPRPLMHERFREQAIVIETTTPLPGTTTVV